VFNDNVITCATENYHLLSEWVRQWVRPSEEVPHQPTPHGDIPEQHEAKVVAVAMKNIFGESFGKEIETMNTTSHDLKKLNWSRIQDFLNKHVVKLNNE